MAEFRLRINFQKLNRLSYLSHLEVVRSMERTLRRSGLPYAVSQGFNVHMRHSFSAALPVATSSLDEYLDIEMDSYIPANQALQRLQLVALENLPIIAVEYVSKQAPSLQVSHNIADYQIVLEFETENHSQELLNIIKTTAEIEVLKKGKPKLYRLSDYLYQLPIMESLPQNERQAILSISLKASQSGSLRPSAILKAVTDDRYPFKIISIVRTSLYEADGS